MATSVLIFNNNKYIVLLKNMDYVMQFKERPNIFSWHVMREINNSKLYLSSVLILKT